MSAEPSRTWREQVVIDFLHLLTDRSVALLANPRGEPRLAAASSEKAGLLELFRLPLPLRDQVIGALNLFSAGGGPLGAADLRIGQALADVATIRLLHELDVHRRETVASSSTAR
jgi:hypothetical protein